MKIGYARISTKDQNLEMQTEALQKAGCEKIFKETQSAVKERPELQNMLAHLRKGDVLVVWKLDRLGRSLKHLIDLVTGFREKGIEFVSLNDSIDTTTVQGRLTFNIFASFAEFERELIRERTMAGLQAARERGRIGGRKKGLSPEAKRTAYACYQLWEDKSRTISEILKIVNVSRATFYRYIAWVKEQHEKK
ncbi:Site-specific DNA recombinase [Saccharicrinis carchari]|uniref:Site-specific DNA recombinase n=1 Tax=Saccharicrinis carchari TaxID=1168039 RepID=A0A521F6N3_SACCC|nr:recombinase family protein [Saccharicrinis carchari]SMO91807.1 Site-specific DNA recombinase [Saccharicrinis carchari]